MITQKLSPPEITPLKGILLILGIVLGLTAASVASQSLSGLAHGAIRQGAIWVLIIVLAAWLMRNRVVEYQYTVSDNRLYVERVYGKRSKVTLDIPVSDVLMLDTEAAVLEKFPGARRMLNATFKSRPLPVFAAAYREGAEMRYALLQPDEAMRTAIFDAEKRRQSAQDKWGDA